MTLLTVFFSITGRSSFAFGSTTGNTGCLKKRTVYQKILENSGENFQMLTNNCSCPLVSLFLTYRDYRFLFSLTVLFVFQLLSYSPSYSIVFSSTLDRASLLFSLSLPLFCSGGREPYFHVLRFQYFLAYDYAGRVFTTGHISY